MFQIQNGFSDILQQHLASPTREILILSACHSFSMKSVFVACLVPDEIFSYLRRLHIGFLLNVGARLFCCFRFCRSLEAIKAATSKVPTILCCNNIIKMIFVFKPRLHEGRRSPVIIWLYSLFLFNLLR